MLDATVSAFVAEQKELLALELQADEEPNDDDRSTNDLGNLEVSDVSVGLYGRTVVQLTLRSFDTSSKLKAVLPAHRLTVGDEVEVLSKKKSKNGFPGGVVCEVSETHVSVALFTKSAAGTKKDSQEGEGDEQDEFGSPPLTLLPRSSADVNRKLMNALTTLEKHGSNHPVAGQLIQALFCPVNFPPFVASSFYPFNEYLDDSQREAISFALQANQPIALIHGPPGTGKTTTISELIQQAVHVHKMKVLVTAPSNVAVDNVLERIVASNNASKSKSRKGQFSSKIRAVRLGHPARLRSGILPYSLEALVQKEGGTEIVTDVRNELQSYLRVVSNPKSRGPEKRLAYREVKSLRKELRTREEKVVQELISSAQVVLATTVGAANRILDNVDAFDLVIIDEAAQALEASCWIPILRGKRVVLAGDHCQLRPTIKSKKAEKGLGKTMFERLMELYGDDKKQGQETISRMLSVQYRMHEKIANWASEAMYYGNLQTHESVRTRTLLQLEGFRKQEDDEEDNFTQPLLLIDTAGCDMHEIIDAAGSRYNPGEALLVARHVQRLTGAGLKQSQMCVITPYNGQVEWLRGLLLPNYPKLEIRSVDGFQGGEREAVILSLVRSSWRGGVDGIGFLNDNRRQNVAVTRAKRHLAVICDSETVSKSKFIATLIDWIEKNGERQSALEYQGSMTVDAIDLEAAEKLMKLVGSSSSKAKALRSKPEKSLAIQKLGPADRQVLMDKIAAFAGTAAPGEEMTLSSTLTSFDRRLVHEFAEQIGLVHRSDGIEGHGRQIILKKERIISDPVVATVVVLENGEVTVSPVQVVVTTSEDQTDHAKDQATVSNGLSFSALSLDDDSDDEETSSDEGMSLTDMQDKSSSLSVGPLSNSLLATLAKERVERQRERTSFKTKKKKPKGQPLGGATRPVPNSLGNLDDMAFLEAQIEKSQNAHGRNVVGSGKCYRTIVNGVLNSQPQPKSTPTNTRAMSSLHARLKQAQSDRKAKAPKKN
jgi:ATP-dependent RNA/DNA helicase IGHMBP2